jgi:hypothetical protein
MEIIKTILKLIWLTTVTAIFLISIDVKDFYALSLRFAYRYCQDLACLHEFLYVGKILAKVFSDTKDRLIEKIHYYNNFENLSVAIIMLIFIASWLYVFKHSVLRVFNVVKKFCDLQYHSVFAGSYGAIVEVEPQSVGETLKIARVFAPDNIHFMKVVTDKAGRIIGHLEGESSIGHDAGLESVLPSSKIVTIAKDKRVIRLLDAKHQFICNAVRLMDFVVIPRHASEPVYVSTGAGQYVSLKKKRCIEHQFDARSYLLTQADWSLLQVPSTKVRNLISQNASVRIYAYLCNETTQDYVSSSGWISGTTTNFIMKHTASTLPGMSGAGCYTSQGVLFGIHNGTHGLYNTVLSIAPIIHDLTVYCASTSTAGTVVSEVLESFYTNGLYADEFREYKGKHKNLVDYDRDVFGNIEYVDNDRINHIIKLAAERDLVLDYDDAYDISTGTTSFGSSQIRDFANQYIDTWAYESYKPKFKPIKPTEQVEDTRELKDFHPGSVTAVAELGKNLTQHSKRLRTILEGQTINLVNPKLVNKGLESMQPVKEVLQDKQNPVPHPIKRRKRKQKKSSQKKTSL